MCPTHPWNTAMQYDGTIIPCCSKGHKCKENYIRQLMFETKKTLSYDDMWEEDWDSPLFSSTGICTWSFNKKEPESDTYVEEEWEKFKKNWLKPEIKQETKTEQEIKQKV